MSFFNSVRNLFQSPSQANPSTILINSPLDYGELPLGFFNVITASGKETLGYRGGFVAWQVGTTVVDGAERVTLLVPRTELPTVRLNFQRSQEGSMQQIGGQTIIDTDTLEQDTTVVWDGVKPQSGVSWV